MNNYVIYHLHSDLSNGVTSVDSVTKYNEYVERAKECGMSALAFAEHGSVMEWWHKKCAIEAAGMKYIHAVEVYVTATLDEKIRDNMHCVLIAKNLDGAMELNRLVSKSFTRTDNHFYYVPRISMEELFSTSANIMVTSACIGGIIAKSEGEQLDRFMEFMADNRERCWLEIAHHPAGSQGEHNQFLYLLSRQYNIPLIAGTDTHCLNDEHVKGRHILQISKNIHFDNEDLWDLRFKTLDELVQAYREQDSLEESVFLTAIDNTNWMADMVEPFSMDKGTKYPHIYDNPEQTFREKISQAVENHPYLLKRYDREDLQKTLDTEIEVYEKCKSIDFMLLETYMREWEHKNDIWCGPGRGSVSGSEVAYALGITDMDSKKFGLNFFRFANPDRVSNADIDTDYGGPDRDKVKEFLLRDKMGLPQIHTSEIITFNTIAEKGAIRDVGRALEIPLSEVGEICNSVGPDGAPDSIRKKYPELFEYVDIVKGTIVSVGTHPSGVLVSDLDIESMVGMCSTAQSPYPVSMLNMKELDDLMYVKLDILGLDNVLIINEACKLAGIERLTPDNVDLEDMNVWRSIRDDTTGIFQWSSNSAQQYIRKFMSDKTIEIAKKKSPNFSMLKWMSFGNGLLRPACASYRDEVAEGKFADNGFKELNDFLAPEAGHVCMQESIMMFLVKFCGYSQAESDTVRRCVDENTDVMMGDGSRKKIKDIQVGDVVMSFDGGYSAPKPVLNVFDNGMAPTIDIKIAGGRNLTATKEHKVLTQRGWVCCGDLTTDDYIMVPSKIFATTDGLAPSYHLYNEEMWAIGALIGDGTIGDGDFRFTNSEPALIEYMEKCLGKRWETRGHVVSDSDFVLHQQDGVTVDKVYTLDLKSSPFKDSWRRLIKQLGLNKKSAEKKIPDKLMLYPAAKKIQSLLGGLFSTDGYVVQQAAAIEYCSISYELIRDIQGLLLKFGILSDIHSKAVSEYGYDSYSLRISGNDSTALFRKYILPYVVGNKQQQYAEACERRLGNSNTYNYLLPQKYKDEIRNASAKSGRSLTSIAGSYEKSDQMGIHKTETGISDIKARHIAQFLYVPETYELLQSDYVPRKVVSVTEGTVHHVYDIEVADTHNYIAGGLIVHNCIAKKKGTETLLPEIEKRFVEYSSTHYDITAEKCAEVIKPFLQTILDASSYAFSWNHSDAYSAIGYICGYLRYYYPYEFITAALNAFSDDEEQRTAITEYADAHNIHIMSPRFGVSKDRYYFNKEKQMIAKGLASVKYMSASVANDLFAISQTCYGNSFLDLLRQIKATTAIDSRQIDSLIKIDYFQQFGNNAELLRLVNIMDFFKCGTAKTIRKDNLDTEMEKFVSAHATDKGVKGNVLKSYTITDMDGLLHDLEAYIRGLHLPELPFRVRAQNQKDILGYVDLTTHLEADRRKIYVLDVRPLKSKFTGKTWSYAANVKSIGTGRTSRLFLKPFIFEKAQFSDGDLLYAGALQKDAKGYWWLHSYNILPG